MVPETPNNAPVTSAPAPGPVPETPSGRGPARAEPDPQQDLFICDVADAVLKDVMQQLEHPFYSLSKKPVTTVREYRHGDHWLRITPSVAGLATIYDKDILRLNSGNWGRSDDSARFRSGGFRSNACPDIRLRQRSQGSVRASE